MQYNGIMANFTGLVKGYSAIFSVFFRNPKMEFKE